MPGHRRQVDLQGCCSSESHVPVVMWKNPVTVSSLPCAWHRLPVLSQPEGWHAHGFSQLPFCLVLAITAIYNSASCRGCFLLENGERRLLGFSPFFIYIRSWCSLKDGINGSVITAFIYERGTLVLISLYSLHSSLLL